MFRTPASEQFAAFSLFGVLAAFTLTTQDGGEFAPRILSAVLLLGAAVYFSLLRHGPVHVSLPVICLLLMVAYGTAATLWWPSKIIYKGWVAVVFWLTAAIITQIAAELFSSRRLASRFRLLLVIFGSAVCALDLLQQASGTKSYFWLIRSKYEVVFGPFAYWNNFAQFIELVLPVTLWMALGARKPRLWLLLLAALQLAAVIGSGSRAGSALVLLETLLLVALAYREQREKRLLWAAGALCALGTIFVAATGFDTVATKLQRPDQLAVRRDLNRSSLELIRQRPLTGWGLDTYSDVYPSVARYDDGSWVNRAHNDWLQWTVEGGVPFALLMVAVAVWTIRPAFVHPWSIGLISVALHAAVDYPFARLGVCGWYFALLGMLIARKDRESRL